MDSLDYIDDYFQREPSPEEASQFEKKVHEDPVFANEVAYYLSTYIALKEVHAEEREKGFRELYQQTVLPAKIRRINTRSWLPALAAASLIAAIVLGWSLFISPQAGPKLADQYILQNLDLMSVKMGTADSMQAGLTLYNDRKYPEALQQFENILRSDSSNLTALLDAGIVSLRIRNYDKALSYFKKLEVRTDPQVNPALFYEALTLMKRNRAGDPAHAKQFLRQIVQQNLNKKQDALQLLRKM
jgi:tetratricopeptide (TPR) repeat protein